MIISSVIACDLFADESKGPILSVFKRAEDIEVGMCVLTTSGIKTMIGKRLVMSVGVYSFLPMEDLPVVDGVVASPFLRNHYYADSLHDVYRMLYARSFISKPWLISMWTQLFTISLNSCISLPQTAWHPKNSALCWLKWLNLSNTSHSVDGVKDGSAARKDA
jgi:hypothetical protein